jgi:hypothetical protein
MPLTKMNQICANIFNRLVSLEFKFENFIIIIYFKINTIIVTFLAFTDDGNVMILCMLKVQAKYMSNFKYFMVDMSYKRVFGEINELEFNAYDENNNSSK